MKSKSFGDFLPILIGILCFLLMLSKVSTSISYSDRVFLSSIFIQLFSLYNIFSKSKEPYSLFKMFYLFSFFFMGIAPLLQFYDNVVMWRMSITTEPEYFLCNMVIIFILIIYKVAYELSQRLDIKIKKLENLNLTKKISQKKSFFLIVVSFISFFLVFQGNNYRMLPMLIRGGDLVSEAIIASTESSESPTKWLLINNFIRPLSMMCFLFYWKSPHRKISITIILFVMALVTCFPAGMPRFAAAAMYIPVMILVIPYLGKKNIFSYTFVAGLLFVFPFLNIFRNYSKDTDLKLEVDLKMFTEQHFDGYQNFALVLSHDLVTYGNQLLGVILFWVPRSMWQGKPIGSGAFSAHELNFVFDNVSATFFAEGFLNFGYVGILIFVGVLAYATAKMDKLYWRNSKNLNHNYFSVLYTISLGFLFFILRGDLMSSTAYLLGFLSAAILVFKIAK